MPCNHKFIEDLNLENLDFEPTTLIVGTFNPSWPANNQAQWFYGRTARNYFWDVLPALYQNEPGLRNIPQQQRPQLWKEFCARNGVAITDLIRRIDDADENNQEHQNLLGGYNDNIIANNFNEFTFTDIIGLLQNNPTIKNVYLTTQAQIPFFNAIWLEVEQYCNQNQNYNCKRLLTPSGGARFQMQGYQPQNLVLNNNLGNFIYENWLDQWHQ
jgi:hypothetical protein